MFSILPKKRFILKSELSLDELKRAIKRNTGDDSGYTGKFAEHDRLFGGSVSDKGFKISINVGYNNAFKPQLSGSFVNEDEMEVHFRLRTLARVFIIVFLSISGIGLLFTPAILINAKEITLGHFGPMFLFFGVLVAVHLAFWFEVPRSKERFEAAVNGRLV